MSSSDEEHAIGAGKMETEGGPANHLEVIRTISRVPGNPNYYEKGGLRTEGDGQDHNTAPKKSLGFVMTIIGCAMGLAGSQIYPLLYLTVGTSIAIELNRQSLFVWMLTAGILAMGSIAPFVGPLADLLGRKPIIIIGFICSVVGSVVCAATPDAPGFIAGQVLLGFGAVMQELLAIAIVAEIVPTSSRPMYAAIVLCAIIPWAPGTLYANYLLTYSWRWIGLLLAVWNFVNLIIIALFYRPPPRSNSRGLSRAEIIKRIDFIGGFMVIVGLLLFLIGLNWGGIYYPYKSAHVLVPLVLGLFILVLFGFYEYYVAPYPLYPRRIVHAPRPFFCMIFVIFAAGINYIPLVVFWPIETIAVFQATHKEVGVYGVPIGVCILGGAIISAILLGIFKKKTHYVMFIFCCIQTIASACLVLIRKDNINTAWAPLILALVGVGGVLVPNQVIITVITPDDLIASVTALTVGLRAQAQVIGLAIFYNQFVNQVTAKAIASVAAPFIEVYGLDGSTTDVFTLMMNDLAAVPFYWFALQFPRLANNQAFETVMPAAIEAFIESFQYIYYITIAFGVAACIAAGFMGDVSRFLDKHVAVQL